MLKNKSQKEKSAFENILVSIECDLLGFVPSCPQQKAGRGRFCRPDHPEL